MLVELLKIGGVAALSIGVMFLLYRQLMQMAIFSVMNQWLTFTLLSVVTVLTFFVAIAALSENGLIDIREISVDGSSGVIIHQGDKP